MNWKKSLKIGGNVLQLVGNAMEKEKLLNVWVMIGLQKKLSTLLIFCKKRQKNEGEEFYDLKLFFVILKLKYWVQTFHTYQLIDSDCIQAIGWPCLTFFDWLNLHFACRDKIGTGQNRPFYPCFGPHRGSWSSKNWFGMAHQVVRYVIQPSWPHAMQQKKRSHLYNGGESVFFGRTPIRGINLNWWLRPIVALERITSQIKTH